jgi:hypothetical protein
LHSLDYNYVPPYLACLLRWVWLTFYPDWTWTKIPLTSAFQVAGIISMSYMPSPMDNILFTSLLFFFYWFPLVLPL